MTEYSRADTAVRAGLDLPYLDRLIELGILTPQSGDVAARIAEYARPGEVLVTNEVVDLSADAGAAFTEIGPVELKGISGAVRLHAAHRAS